MAMNPLHPLARALLAAGLLLPALPTLANEAEVVSIVGKGEARDVGAADWRPASVKQRLRGGAFVRTGDLSTMALLMPDQTQLRVNQNSMLQIKEQAGAGQPTRMELKSGRAWMSSKGPTPNVTIDTPNATAAIRGTEWELEVDPSGKTLLAVYSGTVEFYNDQGRVMVGRNEAALAEAGKAPVKIALTNPRDRVQWVNAYSIDPRRFAEAAKASPAVRSALDAIAKQDLAGARATLSAEKVRGTKVTAVHGLLADLEMVAGEPALAIALLREGLAIAPRDPELLAALVHAQLAADRPEEARATSKQPRDAETAAILAAQGEVARRDGDAKAAFEAFRRATTAAPADDRGWFALGRAQNEVEDSRRARASLAKALELNPRGAGYQGELGTLETFANRFGPAQAAFDRALADNPADYVALTGVGLLKLKQGEPQAALEAFLRAGVLEPRFARAKAWTAVAYYQLGRHAEAIATFQEAARLDDKDPLPWLFLAQVYTDLFRAGDAVQASREALARLPNLKSLNQVANNQQGTANLGYSLAFFGLESWANELAQQSYSPYLAASHLFLADRYAGQYNRNSELFQGFLTDPTAFGGGNRFATLVPRPGQYATLGNTYNHGDGKLNNPYVRLNGLVDGFGRSAYFVDVEGAGGLSEVTNTAPDGSSTKVKADQRVELYALGLGSAITEDLGVFGFATRLRNSTNLRDFAATAGTEDKDRADLGLRYRFSPTSMTWVKAGATREDRSFANYYVFSQDLASAAAANSAFKFRPRDVEVRHSVDLTPADHLAFGYEGARDRREGFYQQVAIIGTPAGQVGIGTEVDQVAKVDSRQAYVSYVRDLARGLNVQADIFWQRFEQDIREDRVGLVTFNGTSIPSFEQTGGRSSKTEWNPRLGIAWTPGRYGVRAAWSRVLQPVSTSTLAPVAVAGLPLDDRLVASGGKSERTAALAYAEFGSGTHVALSYENHKVRNLGQLGFRIPVPQVQFVDLLRNAQLANVNNADLLEGTPDFDSGRVEATSLAWNQVVTPQLSVNARLTHSRNRATIYIRDDAGDIVSSGGAARVPFVPERLATVGFTWVTPWRLYLSAQAVYRSERYADRDNTARLEGDTTGTVALFWESADKRLIVGAGAGNLGSKSQKEAWILDARLRF